MAGTGKSTEYRLRRCAVELFANRGYSATGIREIATAAGLTSATIYHYTSSKENLLLDLMRDGQIALTEATALGVSGLQKPEDRLGVLVGVLAATHVLNPYSTRVIDSEIRALQPDSESRSEIVRLRDAYEELWNTAIIEGFDLGVFKLIDPHISRLSLITMCTGISNWYRKKGGRDHAYISTVVVDLALGSLRASRNGIELRAENVPAVQPEWLTRFPWEPENV